ncbi:MAG: LD-carboxypeptidase, partial [Actinomycetota bacterium]|nr:LD-carboxypeptidase [Actinomycetota bacterium]
LALLAADLGTPFSRPGTGAIVLLEDIGEDTYQVDRSLTQLLRAGWFDGVSGLVLGEFTDCNDLVELDAVLEARLAPLAVPMVRHLDFGHTTTTCTMPLGVVATLDASAGSLRLARPALT